MRNSIQVGRSDAGLLVKVRDLMHSGQDVPQVEETVLASVAILEMSAKKLGMTTVVDRAGALLGVITDGDLRRFVQQGGDFSKITRRVLSLAPSQADWTG